MIRLDLIFLDGFWFVYIPCILILMSFSYQLYLALVQQSFRDNMSLHFSKTRLSIPADLNNAVFWMGSILPPISNFAFIFPNVWEPLHHHHHHHHVVPLARISLTLSRYFSLSFIASGRSSGLHPVSSHSCCMYIQAGRPAFARPYVGVHRSTSLMSSSLLFQQCPACLFRLTWIVFVMRGRWPYSWCFVGCCLQDLFNIARSILV